MSIFFTADTHLNHNAIVRFCNRPFDNVSQMNETMYDLWTSTIGPKDEVYHIGDVAFGNVESVVKRFKSLSGKKFLVPGNHDQKNIATLGEAFKILPPLWETSFDKQRATLCHYPLLAWNASFRGAVNFFGHVHGRIPGNNLQIDVSVDMWDFAPVRLETLLERMKTLPPYEFPDAGEA